ncbi:MAG TPA: PHP domain-containing protein [Bacteroidales bacterium]|nr:PHP domain-containing protein [Bacteroidales bacterium]
MIFDLHVHTNFSDGLLTPKQVIDLAIDKGLDGIAITDHDTVSGIEPAIQYSKKVGNLHIIPGLEFSCIYEDEEVHILGYFFDYKSDQIINITKDLRKNRIIRGMKMIKKINNLGLELTLEEVKKLSKRDYIGRPHIARALVVRKYVKSLDDAFDKLLNRGMPGYVEKDSLELEETIQLIHESNGISVLAHPGLLRNNAIIKQSIKSGIDGLEAIHSKHSKEDV